MPIFRWFIVRRLRREASRTALTVLGISLGVAVVLAVRLANRSAIEGFRSALDTVAGRTSLEITAAGTGIDERRLPELAWLAEWGEVSPVIEGDADIAFADGHDETVHVLGIDILQDQPFREYALRTGEAPQPSSDAFLRLLADANSVVVTQAFASRHRLSPGSAIDVVFGDAVRRLSVRGVLADEGVARVVDGNLLVMDIAPAQWAFDRLGRIDRLDVRLRDASRLDEAEARIAARLPAGLAVERPARRGAQVERMLASFQFNLGALSLVSLLVGMFLLYNTVAAGVVTRRDEIGILRAVGTSRRTVLGLFVGEALLLTAGGCVAGVALGWAMAWASVHLTASTVATLYVNESIELPTPTFSDVALSFALGIPLALIASLAPALEAWRISPLEAIRSTPGHDVARRRLRPVLIALGAFVLAALAARQPPLAGLPVYGFLSAMLIIAGASQLASPALSLLGGIGPGAWLKLGIEARLAAAQILSSIARLSVPVAALATSFAMVVAIAVMVGSFRETVVYWVGQTLQADLFIATGRRSNLGAQPTMSDDLVRTIRSNADVIAVDPVSSVNVPYQGRLVVVAANDWRVLLSRATLTFKAPGRASDAVRQALGRDAVIVSESFSVRFGVQPGSALALATPTGNHRFEVLAVYYDYSTDRGVVLMDRDVFARSYGEARPTSAAVYLRPGVDPDAVRRTLTESLGASHHVLIRTNASLRREVLRIFDRTFAVTYGLEAIALLVSLLGVAGTMITLVLERRRELTLLRLVGADARQVRRTVVIESGLVGVASQLLGLPVGFLLSVLLIDVINVQSFGWTIQWHIPTLYLAQASAALLLASLAAGLYPARIAARATVSADREVQ